MLPHDLSPTGILRLTLNDPVKGKGKGKGMGKGK